MKAVKPIILSLLLSFIALVFISCAQINSYFFHECVFSYAYTEKPTCTNNGYDLYRCTCGKTERNKYTMALGHLYLSGITVDPTCSSEGYTVYACTRCEYEKIPQNSRIPMLPHSIVEDGIVEPSCTKEGIDKGSHCDSCGAIIREETVIPMIDHVDKDIDGICDECQYVIQIIISITTVEDLRAIEGAPDLSYRLDQNIILQEGNWQPLCSPDNPFKGTFYGNGYTIKNIYTNDNTISGLFHCNNGTITGLSIQNINVNLANTNCKIGGVAVINNGVIDNCSFVGDFQINGTFTHSDETQWPSYNGTTATYSVVAGAITAQNNGTVKNAVVSGNTRATVSVYNEYYLSPSPLFFIDTSYHSYCNVNITLGGIVGTNYATVENSSSIGSYNAEFKLSADHKKKGISHAILNAELGGISGINKNTITNCEGKEIVYVSDVEKTSISGYNGIECTLNVTLN